MLIADLNGDGKLDLALGTYGSVAILLGNGDGTFLAPVNYAVPGSVNAIVARDFNADGKEDLAVLTENTVSVFPGNGDGTFGAAALFGVGITSTSLVAFDGNGDGKPDLAVGNGSDAVAVLTNTLK